MTLYIDFHPGYEKGDDGEWSVWDDAEDAFPEPFFTSTSRQDCEGWIAENPLFSKSEGG